MDSFHLPWSNLSSFTFPFNTTTWQHQNKVETHYVEPQGSLLSVEVTFVRIDPVDQKLLGDNQGHVELSNSSVWCYEISLLLSVSRREMLLSLGTNSVHGPHQSKIKTSKKSKTLLYLWPGRIRAIWPFFHFWTSRSHSPWPQIIPRIGFLPVPVSSAIGEAPAQNLSHE